MRLDGPEKPVEASIKASPAHVVSVAKRFLQFSAATVVLLSVLLAIFAYRKEQVLRRLDANGGDREINKSDLFGRFLLPQFLNYVPRAFRETETLGFQDTNISPQDWRDINVYSDARIIAFTDCQSRGSYTGTAIFTNLKSILCERSRIHVMELPKAPNLELLRYQECLFDVSDALALGAYPRLTVLTLSETTLNDEGLAAIPNLPLTSLHLHETEISDTGLESISRFTKLRRLELTGTNISDEGFEKLVACTDIRVLGVNGTQITDKSVEVLMKLDLLEYLDVSETQISAAGITRLIQHPTLKSIGIMREQWSKTIENSLKGSKSLREINIIEPLRRDGIIQIKLLDRINNLRIQFKPNLPASIKLLFNPSNHDSRVRDRSK